AIVGLRRDREDSRSVRARRASRLPICGHFSVLLSKYWQEEGMTEAYRYVFAKRVPLTDAIESLYLAIFAAEGVHGRAQVRLDAGYAFDQHQRALVVAAATVVGKTISQIFTSLLAR